MGAVHIGTMGWSYEFWKDIFYPYNMKIGDALKEYSKHFNAVEINSSFYRTPSQNVVRKWRNETPDDFTFAAKFPKKVTHIKMLKECEDDVEFFVGKISQLKEKLGPLLLQFPPNFKPDKFNMLKNFLRTLPKGHRYAIEVRNKDWFNDEFYSLLRDNDVALALLDHPWLPSIDVLTSNFVYIRWERDQGNNNEATRKMQRNIGSDMEKWVQKIKAVDVNHDVFGFFSKYYMEIDKILAFARECQEGSPEGRTENNDRIRVKRIE